MVKEDLFSKTELNSKKIVYKLPNMQIVYGAKERDHANG
jgi:hypothetical protein